MGDSFFGLIGAEHDTDGYCSFLPTISNALLVERSSYGKPLARLTAFHIPLQVPAVIHHHMFIPSSLIPFLHLHDPVPIAGESTALGVITLIPP